MKKADRIAMMIHNTGASVTEYRKGRESNFFMVRVGGLWGLEKSTSGCTCGVKYADTREEIEAYIEANGYKAVKTWTPDEQPTPETATPDAPQEAANDEPEATTTEQTVTETMEESNMRTYKVSFIVDGICQGNMAIAENAEDVEAYYNREYSGRGEVFAVREAAEWEIEEDRRRGMPFVKVPVAKPEEPDAATGSKQEETEMTLENLYALTLNNLDADDGDIVGVAVYTDGGDTVEEFNDVRDVINRYGNREIEPILFDGSPMSMTEPDAHGMIHVALVEKETEAGSPAPVQETHLDIAAFYKKYVEEYGFLYDNGDNVAGFGEAVKAFSTFTESEANAAFVREFCAYMGDYITSDREAAAFMFALESMTAPPMCETEAEMKPAPEFNAENARLMAKAATPVNQTVDSAETGQPALQEGKPNMTDEERIDALFHELVPMVGKADTVAGEIVRAVCRIGYRYNNDGDYLGCGYGKETCNPAARYLIANAGEAVAEIVRCLWAAGEECGILDDGSYDDWLSELMKATLAYPGRTPGTPNDAKRGGLLGLPRPG